MTHHPALGSHTDPGCERLQKAFAKKEASTRHHGTTLILPPKQEDNPESLEDARYFCHRSKLLLSQDNGTART